MTAFYDRAQATVMRALATYGRAATLTRTTNGVYNPAVGAPSTATTASYPIRALRAEHERSHIDGSLIEAGREAFLIDPSGLPVDPKAGDVLVWMGSHRTVAKAGTLAPGGEVVMHEVQVVL